MKDALDGKFFYFTHDGAVKCKEVNENFSGASSFNNNYSKEYMVKGGKKAIGDRKRNRVTWSEGQVEWLKKHMRHRSPKQCAEALNVPYYRVYDKINALRKAAAK